MLNLLLVMLSFLFLADVQCLHGVNKASNPVTSHKDSLEAVDDQDENTNAKSKKEKNGKTDKSKNGGSFNPLSTIGYVGGGAAVVACGWKVYSKLFCNVNSNEDAFLNILFSQNAQISNEMAKNFYAKIHEILQPFEHDVCKEKLSNEHLSGVFNRIFFERVYTQSDLNRLLPQSKVVIPEKCTYFQFVSLIVKDLNNLPDVECPFLLGSVRWSREWVTLKVKRALVLFAMPSYLIRMHLSDAGKAAFWSSDKITFVHNIVSAIAPDDLGGQEWVDCFSDHIPDFSAHVSDEIEEKALGETINKLLNNVRRTGVPPTNISDQRRDILRTHASKIKNNWPGIEVLDVD